MEQKAQVLLASDALVGRYIKVVRCRRGIGDGLGRVRDLFWKGNEPWMVVQFPTGRRTAVPLCWTDLGQDAYPVKKTSPKLPPAGLLKMAEYLLGLKGRRRRKPTS